MEHFLAFADLIQQPVIYLDSAGCIKAINQAAESLYGWQNMAVQGQSIIALHERDHIAFKWPDNLREDITPANSVIEVTVPQAGHTYKIIAWQITKITAPDTINGFLLVGSDVTVYKSLQEANENQQSYLDFVVANIPCYIYWKDCNSIYLGCNEQFAKAAGYHSPTEVVGKSDYELAWGQTEADLFRKGDLEVLSGISKVDFEEPQLMADGKYAIVLANKVPIRNRANNKIIGVLGIYFDITERKQAEENVKQAQLRAEAFEQIAIQAAHDIRSPLAALEAMFQSLKNLPEPQRILIRNAVERIKDIANNLLIQHKTKGKLFNVSDAAHSNVNAYLETPILLIIESIISEKRTQYKSRDLRFLIESDAQAYSLFARIKHHQFKRLLSNIIDNAAEAIKDKGTITLKLAATADNVLLSVCDDGAGIHPDILPKVFQSNFSFGKQHGSGLGLAYAKKCVEEWGGKISIASQPGQGTELTIQLALLPLPGWYPRELIFNKDSCVVILDDDKSGHDLWNQRFADITEGDISIFHFFQASELIHWYEQNKDKKALFLVDYELINDENTGLDIIEKLNIKHDAVLVTSHFENADLQKRCAELNLRLFPKMLAYYIPLRFVKNNIDLIYLDDDPTVTSSWQWLAESSGRNILTFNYINELMSVVDHYAKDIPIYIDSELGDNIMKGEELAKILYDKGFHNLYLATGHARDHFDDIPWIKAVLGKNPDILLG